MRLLFLMKKVCLPRLCELLVNKSHPSNHLVIDSISFPLRITTKGFDRQALTRARYRNATHTIPGLKHQRRRQRQLVTAITMCHLCYIFDSRNGSVSREYNDHYIETAGRRTCVYRALSQARE